MPRPTDWHAIGLSGDPTPGEPEEIRALATELRNLGGSAREISTAIDAVMNTAGDSVFVGQAADALRGKVDDRLRHHIEDVAQSFESAATTLSGWADKLVELQQRADGALNSGRGLAEDDPQRETYATTARQAGTEHGEGASTAAGSIRGVANIQLPISECQVFWEAFQWLAIILIIPALIFGGPIALLALGVNLTLFIKTIVDFARGDANFLDLFLAGLGILAPTTKALPIFQIVKAGGTAFAKGFTNIARGTFQALRNLFTGGFRFTTIMPGLRDFVRLSTTWVRQGGLWVVQGIHNLPALAGMTFQRGGLTVLQNLRGLPGVVRGLPADLGRGLTAGWNGLGRGLAGGWHGVTVGAKATWNFTVNELGGTKALRLILPVDAGEIGQYGLRGALRIGFVDRGLMGNHIFGAPLGGAVAHGVGHGVGSGIAAGHHGLDSLADVSRLELNQVRLGDWGGTAGGIRPFELNSGPLDLASALRAPTLHLDGAGLGDRAGLGFHAARHIDAVVDIPRAQLGGVRLDGFGGTPGRVDGGLGVSAAAPQTIVHPSGLHVPANAGAPGVQAADLVTGAPVPGGSHAALTVAQAPPAAGAGAHPQVNSLLTGAQAPTPGTAGLGNLLTPGAPGTGSGSVHAALTGTQTPPPGAAAHDLPAAGVTPGGTTAGTHPPVTAIGQAHHAPGTGPSAFDLLATGGRGTPDTPVPANAGTSFGDHTAGALAANQTRLHMDELVHSPGSPRPGAAPDGPVPGSAGASPGPSPADAGRGVAGAVPPGGGARSALDLVDAGPGVRNADGPAFAGASGGAGDSGHAFAGAPVRKGDDPAGTGVHDDMAHAGAQSPPGEHVAVVARPQPEPLAAGSAPTGHAGPSDVRPGTTHAGTGADHAPQSRTPVERRQDWEGAKAQRDQDFHRKLSLEERFERANPDLDARFDAAAQRTAAADLFGHDRLEPGSAARGHAEDSARRELFSEYERLAEQHGGAVPAEQWRAVREGLDSAVDAHFDRAALRSRVILDQMGEDLDRLLVSFREDDLFGGRYLPPKETGKAGADADAGTAGAHPGAKDGDAAGAGDGILRTHDDLRQYMAGKYREAVDASYRADDGVNGPGTGAALDARLDAVRADMAQQIRRLGERERFVAHGTDAFERELDDWLDDLISGGSLNEASEKWVREAFQNDLRAAHVAMHRGADELPPGTVERAWEAHFERAVSPESLHARFEYAAFREGRFTQARTVLDDALDRFENDVANGAELGPAGRERVTQAWEKAVDQAVADHWFGHLGRQDFRAGTPATADRAWAEAFDELTGTLWARMDHESMLQNQLGRSARDFERIIGHPDSLVHRYDVREATADQLAKDFRERTVTEYDRVWSTFEQDIKGWLRHEAAHENLFTRTVEADFARGVPDAGSVRPHPVESAPGEGGLLHVGDESPTPAPVSSTPAPVSPQRTPVTHEATPHTPASSGTSLPHTAHGGPDARAGQLDALVERPAAVGDDVLETAVRQDVDAPAPRLTDRHQAVTPDAGTTPAPHQAHTTTARPPAVSDLVTTGHGAPGTPAAGQSDALVDTPVTTGDDVLDSAVRQDIDGPAPVTGDHAAVSPQAGQVSAPHGPDVVDELVGKGKGKAPVGDVPTTSGATTAGDWRTLSDAGVALTDARRSWDDALSGFADAERLHLDGVGSSAHAGGEGLARAWDTFVRADAEQALVEQRWTEVSGGAPLPEVREVEARYGILPGGASPSRWLERFRGHDTAPATPAPGVVQSVTLVPAASHVVIDGTKAGRVAGREGKVLIPTSRDLTVAHWLRDPAGAQADFDAERASLTWGRSTAATPELVSAFDSRLASLADDFELFRSLRTRPVWQDLRPPQAAVLVMAERRGLSGLEADRAAVVAKLNGAQWTWAQAYREAGGVDRVLEPLVDKVVRHLREDLTLTVNMKLDGPSGPGGSVLDAMLRDDKVLLRNAWEDPTPNLRYLGDSRGPAEESLGYGATVKRTTESHGVYPGRPGERFAPRSEDVETLPGYAALTSRHRPQALQSYGTAVFHLKHHVMERSTFTPMDSFMPGAKGVEGVTGLGNLTPLLAHGPENLVRLAFAEATDFAFDAEFRALRDAGQLPSRLTGYFEAQVHGRVLWKDLDRVTLVHDGNSPADAQRVAAQKQRLDAFAHTHGLGFTVETRPVFPGARPAAAVSVTTGTAGTAVDEVAEEVSFAAGLLDEHGAPRTDLLGDPADAVKVTHVTVTRRPGPVPGELSREDDLFHSVNLRLKKLGKPVVDRQDFQDAYDEAADWHGALIGRLNTPALADDITAFVLGVPPGRLPAGAPPVSLTDDAPVAGTSASAAGASSHHMQAMHAEVDAMLDEVRDLARDLDVTVSARTSWDEAVDDVELGAHPGFADDLLTPDHAGDDLLDGEPAGPPLRSVFEDDDESLDLHGTAEEDLDDLDDFSRFVAMVRPMRDHLQEHIDNPAADIEVAIVANPGGRTWQDFSENVGHAAVAVWLPGERAPLTMGFYPTDGLWTERGLINDDSGYALDRQVRVLGVYRVTAAQLFDAYRYAVENVEHTYNLLRYNCVRFAEGFVSAALGHSVADLWVAAPYRLVRAMEEQGSFAWADGPAPRVDLTAEDRTAYGDADAYLKDGRNLTPDEFAHAVSWARYRVAFDHQRPLVVDGATPLQNEQFEMLDQFSVMVARTLHDSGEDAAVALSHELGLRYGTLRVTPAGPSAPAASTSAAVTGHQPVVAPDTATALVADDLAVPQPASTQPHAETVGGPSAQFDTRVDAHVDDMADDLGAHRVPKTGTVRTSGELSFEDDLFHSVNRLLHRMGEHSATRVEVQDAYLTVREARGAAVGKMTTRALAEDVTSVLMGHGVPRLRGGAPAAATGVGASSGQSSHHTDLTARGLVAAQRMTADPGAFLQSNVLSMELDQGLARHLAQNLPAGTPELSVSTRRDFLRALNDPAVDEHRFVMVTDGRVDAQGLAVYTLAPAVEWYVERYGHQLTRIPEGTMLPEVRGDADYMRPVFVPYLTGGSADPLESVGHAQVLRNPGPDDPRLVVTPAMNGCAYTVTAGADAEHFTVWHYQSPESNIRHAVDFRRDMEPTDWFGAGEYYKGDLTQERQLFEVANVLWHDGNEWRVIGQENHTAIGTQGAIRFAGYVNRPLVLEPGHELDHVVRFYKGVATSERDQHNWSFRQTQRRILETEPRGGADVPFLQQLFTRIETHITGEIRALDEVGDFAALRACAERFTQQRAALRGELDGLIRDAAAAGGVVPDAVRQAMIKRGRLAGEMVEEFVNRPAKNWTDLLRDEGGPAHPTTLSQVYRRIARLDLDDPTSRLQVSVTRIHDARLTGGTGRLIHGIVDDVRRHVAGEIERLGGAHDTQVLREHASAFAARRTELRDVLHGRYIEGIGALPPGEQLTALGQGLQLVDDLLESFVTRPTDEWISHLARDVERYFPPAAVADAMPSSTAAGLGHVPAGSEATVGRTAGSGELTFEDDLFHTVNLRLRAVDEDAVTREEVDSAYRTVTDLRGAAVGKMTTRALAEDVVALLMGQDLPGLQGGARGVAPATHAIQQAAEASGSGSVRMSVAERHFADRPREFLASSVVSTDLDDGLRLYDPGLQPHQRRTFLQALDRPEVNEHRFVLVGAGRTDTAGNQVHVLAPAVEWYARNYPEMDLGLPGSVGERAVRADGEYLKAVFVPYKQGGSADPLESVGHAQVPRNPGPDDPRLVVTPAMNGCAYTVTAGADAEHFTVWHYQSPESNIRHAVDFRRDMEPTDWFGAGEYYRSDVSDSGRLFETANVLWHDGTGWRVISQESHTPAHTAGDVTLAGSLDRALVLEPGRELDHVVRFYKGVAAGERDQSNLSFRQLSRKILATDPPATERAAYEGLFETIRERISREIRELELARDFDTLRSYADYFTRHRLRMAEELESDIADAASRAAQQISSPSDPRLSVIHRRRDLAQEMVRDFVHRPANNWIALLRDEGAAPHPRTLAQVYESMARNDFHNPQSRVNSDTWRIEDSAFAGRVRQLVDSVVTRVRAHRLREIERLHGAGDLRTLRSYAHAFEGERQDLRTELLVTFGAGAAQLRGQEARVALDKALPLVQELLTSFATKPLDEWITKLRNEVDRYAATSPADGHTASGSGTSGGSGSSTGGRTS